MIYIFTICSTCMFRSFLTIIRVRCYRVRNTRWFKYDRDDLCVNKSQFVPVIFEPPCITTCAFVQGVIFINIFSTIQTSWGIFTCVFPCIFTIMILSIQQMHTLYCVKHFTGLPTCFDPVGSSSGHLIH